MQKLDVMIARMRLLLADIASRESQLNQLIRQYHAQTEKIMSRTLYGDATVDSTLAMMSDVHERRELAERSRAQLHQLRLRTETELESLQLTRRIEELRIELTSLRERSAQLTGEDATSTRADLSVRMRLVQSEINDASERAAQTIGVRQAR
ncbi:MAG: hypothetical protein ACKVVP_20900 [Chloroflexota bacterium]